MQWKCLQVAPSEEALRSSARYGRLLKQTKRALASTGVRVHDIELARVYEGRVSAYYPSFPEGELVRVHFIIGRVAGATPRPSQRGCPHASGGRSATPKPPGRRGPRRRNHEQSAFFRPFLSSIIRRLSSNSIAKQRKFSQLAVECSPRGRLVRKTLLR